MNYRKEKKEVILSITEAILHPSFYPLPPHRVIEATLDRLHRLSYFDGYRVGRKKGEADATAIKVPFPSHSRSSIS